VTDDYEYAGAELSLFARAKNWKGYLTEQLGPFIRGHVLEVGAGMGATTSALWTAAASQWTALEPDPRLADQARMRVCDIGLDRVVVRRGTIAALDAEETFDTILYIDVLEHIEQDAAELQDASRHLRPGAHLIVLSPAHQWLFSPFDAAIGHVRRYNARALRSLRPSGLALSRLRYLDAVGMTASLGNRIVLRRLMPSGAQIAFWDRVLVPASRVVDPLFAYRIGKSILAVWQRPLGP
jgi:2-polyprenyl-3-methyl-5-hydroxy-6-metoxy-1,4-benzoquinol methylase